MFGHPDRAVVGMASDTLGVAVPVGPDFRQRIPLADKGIIIRDFALFRESYHFAVMGLEALSEVAVAAVANGDIEVPIRQ